MSLVAIDQSCSLIFTLPVVKCAPMCPNPFAHSVYGKWPGLSGHNTLCIYGLSKAIGFVNNGHFSICTHLEATWKNKKIGVMPLLFVP